MHSASVFNSPVVTIAVGPNKVAYFVHEQALARAKAGLFFNRACTNGFREAQTRYLELPEDDPGAFEVFAEWLYGTCWLGEIEAVGNMLFEYSPPQLLRNYIFAHKYLVRGLQDNITSEMYDRMQAEY